MTESNNDKNRLLFEYAGFASQMAVSLALSVYIGVWVDKKINWKIPLFIWILPVLVLIATFIKVIKDTSKK